MQDRQRVGGMGMGWSGYVMMGNNRIRHEKGNEERNGRMRHLYEAEWEEKLGSGDER
jgi:hypothetical protein